MPYVSHRNLLIYEISLYNSRPSILFTNIYELELDV